MAIFSRVEDRPLTPKEIKREIMALGNLSEEEYRKQRDVLRLRLRNYETYTGAPQRNTSEVWLRILRRQQSGTELLGYEKTILATPAQTTSAFKKSYFSRGGLAPRRVENIAIDNLINNTFQGFLAKSTKGRTAFYEWLNAQTIIDPATGEILGYNVSAKQIEQKLNALTKELRIEKLSAAIGAGKYWRNIPTT